MIVITDRGFARSRLRKNLKKMNMGYIVRIPKTTHLLSSKYHGALENLPLRSSRVRDFQKAQLGKDAKVHMRLIAKKTKIQGKWTTWYLATSLQQFAKDRIIP